MSGYEIGSWDWWGFVACLLGCLTLTFWAGMEWCRYHHKQRGQEVDRIGLHDLLPMPPSPTVVPDHVPDWMNWEEDQRKDAGR